MPVALPTSLVMGALERRAARRGAYCELECWADLAVLEPRPSLHLLAKRWRCSRVRVRRLIEDYEKALSPSVVEPAREMEPPGIGLQPKVDRSVDHAPAAPVSDYRISPIADRITAMQAQLETDILAHYSSVPQPVPDEFDGRRVEQDPDTGRLRRVREPQPGDTDDAGMLDHLVRPIGYEGQDWSLAVPQPVPQAPEKVDYFDGINLETQSSDPVGDPQPDDATTDSYEGILNEALASQATTRETDPATAALEDEFEGLLGRG